MSEFILATGVVDQIARDNLQPFGEVVIASDFSEETLAREIEHALALIVRGVMPISEKVMASGKRLKVIGRAGAGYNNVDIAAATRLGLPVVYAPGMGSRAVAEGALMFMLMLAKRAVFWDRQVKSGNWTERDRTRPGDLEGTTIGLIGFGNIGQHVAMLAEPFRARILAYDPFVSPEIAKGLSTSLVDLDTLLHESDIVSLHTAVTPESKGLINRERLNRMKRGAILINMARGEVIESIDLLHEFLLSGHLSGVGLDVFFPEPPDVSHPIFKLEQCLTAPHALGLTERAMYRIFNAMSEDMVAVLNGTRPVNCVNPKVFE